MSGCKAARWLVLGLCGVGLLPGACELITEPANNVLVNNHLERHYPATIADLQADLYGVPVDATPPE